MRVAVPEVTPHAPLTSATLVVVATLLHVVLIVGLLPVEALAVLRHERSLVMHLTWVLELTELHLVHAIASLLPLILIALVLVLLALPLVSVNE